jgi:hypothetical protein
MGVRIAALLLIVLLLVGGAITAQREAASIATKNTLADQAIKACIAEIAVDPQFLA